MLLRLLCTAFVTIATMREPGERLVVSGQLFDPSGKKPAAGVTIHAYHTDARGYYNEPGRTGHRLSGTVTTDAHGRFEIRTIRPGAYPGRKDPAHIHLEAWGGGYARQWLDAIELADDPRVTPAMLSASAAKGAFAPIVTPKRDGKGGWRAEVRLRLK